MSYLPDVRIIAEMMYEAAERALPAELTPWNQAYQAVWIQEAQRLLESLSESIDAEVQVQVDIRSHGTSNYRYKRNGLG